MPSSKESKSQNNNIWFVDADLDADNGKNGVTHINVNGSIIAHFLARIRVKVLQLHLCLRCLFKHVLMVDFVNVPACLVSEEDLCCTQCFQSWRYTLVMNFDDAAEWSRDSSLGECS